MYKNLPFVLWLIVPLLVLAGSCTTVDSTDRSHLNNDLRQAANSDEVLSPEKALKRHVLAKDLKRDPLLLDKMSADTIKLVLGKPELERVEGYSTAYHYQSKYCTMNVYFAKAADLEVGSLIPSYIDMLPVKSGEVQLSKERVNREKCIKSIL
jgi:hypothetical protein